MAIVLAVTSACAGADGGEAGPASSGGATSTTVAPSTTLDAPTVAEERTFAVGSREESYVDETRQTKSHQASDVLGERTLPVLVLYPAEGRPGGAVTAGAAPATERGPFPLIVFSHGVGAFGAAYQATLEVIASAGYVVAAPTYPLANAKTTGGPTISDADEQTNDISFLFDQLTDATAGSDGPYAGLIDGERLGVAGHSLGGITSIGAGYQPCCTDDRIDAVAEWSGVLLPIAGDGSDEIDPEAAGRPLLIVHGAKDQTVRYQSATELYAEVAPPKFLVTLPLEGHIPAFLTGLGSPASTVVTLTTIDFFDRYLKADPAGLDRLRADVAVDPAVATLEADEG